MSHAVLRRLVWVGLLLTTTYALAMWQPVRAWYSDVDKLVHGLVFAGVYVALAWALRWRPLTLATLVLGLGAAVEVHQSFLPGFSASLKDWGADAVGISLVCSAHLGWQRWCAQVEAEELLHLAQFQHAMASLPIVLVASILTNRNVALLAVQRKNAPAHGACFATAWRIRKGEPLAEAEHGLPDECSGAQARSGAPMANWVHSYKETIFPFTRPTQYVNLPCAARLSEAEANALCLPVNKLHGRWQWLRLERASGRVYGHVGP